MMNVKEITDGIFKVGIAFSLVLLSVSTYKWANKPTPINDRGDITITIKEYNENEKKVAQYMDSVSSLSPDEQLRIVKELADKYKGQYKD